MGMEEILYVSLIILIKLALLFLVFVAFKKAYSFLKKYIENFTEQYKTKPEQFYNKVDNKNNEITLKIKTDDLQFQILTHFMKTMNIEFNIESFIKK